MSLRGILQKCSVFSALYISQPPNMFWPVFSSSNCRAWSPVHYPTITPGVHSHLGHFSRLLARCERDEVPANVDIHTLVRESSITRQDIRDILVSLNSGLIYRHVSENFEMRQEQVESVEDETNQPFTLSFSSFLMLSRWECKPGITNHVLPPPNCARTLQTF